MIKTSLLRASLGLAASLAAAGIFAQDVVAPAPAGAGATTIYRQVMPDGRILYSDKLQKGAKIERTVPLEPPVQAMASTSAAPGVHIQRSPAGSETGPPAMLRARDEADMALMKAEMLLEETRKRQAAGVEPLPGERTANVGGGSRLNQAYWERQEALAQDVAAAEEALREARARHNQVR